MKTPTRIMACVTVFGLSQLARATPIIDVGEHELLANTPDQSIQIMVAGGDDVQGVNFRIQVADGGTHPEVGGSIDGPVITDIDLMTGTIFDGNHTGQNSLLSFPQVSVQSITTETGTVPANGLLATVTFDTTGFSDGEFNLHIGDTRDGATDFAGIPVNIMDGSLRVVPEPTGIAMLLTAAVLFAAAQRVGRKPVC